MEIEEENISEDEILICSDSNGEAESVESTKKTARRISPDRFTWDI